MITQYRPAWVVVACQKRSKGVEGAKIIGEENAANGTVGAGSAFAHRAGYAGE